MPGQAVEVEGLREFRAALAAMGKEWPRELAKTHRRLASEVAIEARQFAVGSGPVQAHFANLIQGRGFPDRATIGVRSKGNAAIWGAKKRTGWFAAGKYSGLSSNQPKWVGNTWEVGGPGGPYGINDAIRHDLPKIIDRYDDLIDVLTRKAFPN